jgi:hypothetical protein
MFLLQPSQQTRSAIVREHHALFARSRVDEARSFVPLLIFDRANWKVD